MNDRLLLHWLWFAGCMGAGANTLDALSVYGGPDVLRDAMDSEDISAVVPAPVAERMRNTSPEDCRGLLETCRRMGVRVITMEHEQYPNALRLLENAPPVLYCTGDAECLNMPHTVGMVGSRRPSAYGLQAARAIAQDLAAAGAVLVSGMADGLDSEAHRAAVAAGRPTIAVMGTGHDQCYPPQNAALRAGIEKCGAVVSEIAPGMGGLPYFFRLRNRIIAALSETLCVVEARKASGTMITAKYSMQYGRPVFSVPGSIFSPMSEGTNQLLRSGGQVCTGAKEILEQIGMEAVPRKKTAAGTAALSANARKVKAALRPTAQSIGELCEATGLGTGALSAALTELELSGIADQQAGRRYLLRK